MSVQFIPVPYVDLLEKTQIKLLDKYITHVIIYYGSLDKTDIPHALNLLKEKGLTIDPNNLTYFIGSESIVVEKHTGMSPFREALFNIMGRNSVKATTYFRLPPDKVCIIGSQIKL